ncbi:hypothetical protein [Nitrincola iocasae]|uniref:VPLPA-CTERM sorting domain-containing protein n=1 Tax=Nitrincola iocasae TaxID=2614693 RepID=A0A5J6LC26_9GAMM|nr:hypothetical protein [Nitrincola iocasae]QEW06234.1 hypothetical protein F5I99_06830 [Nitrincola iocasae]
MKKMLLALVLMLASFAVSAASISIGNPTVSPGNFYIGSPGYTNTTLTDTLRTDTIQSGYAILGGQLSTSWALSSDVDASFSLGVSGTGTSGMASWTVSILNSGGDLLTSGSLGSVFESLMISAGDTLTAVIAGTISSNIFASKSFSASLALSSIQIAETPLPAAIWLFGSVLLGGLAMRRRKAQQVAAVVA